MELRKFCVYNQTCECFLCLGVMLFESSLPQPSEVQGGQALHLVEGSWLIRSRDQPSFILPSTCDLVYLDVDLHVVQVIEAFPTHRVAQWRQGAASVLALSPHTVYSSQTKLGHQLIISVAAEMEFQLRDLARGGRGGETNIRTLEIAKAGNV